MSTIKLKRPSSAYIFFCNKLRSEVKTENPDKKPTEITKIIAERWNSLTPDEKVPFLEQAVTDKERYLKEKGDTTTTASPSGAKKTTTKRAPTAYMLFANSVRASIREDTPGIKLGDVSKKTSEMWKKLNDEEKEDFVIESKKQKDASAAAAETTTTVEAVDILPPVEASSTKKINKKSK